MKYEKGLITFPENLIEQFDELNNSFSSISKGIKGEFDEFSGNLEEQKTVNKNSSSVILNKYEEIFDAFSSLQNSLDAKDSEIERLKRGYDFQILKKFTLNLIRVLDFRTEIFEKHNPIDKN